jgi:hypothetical protein
MKYYENTKKMLRKHEWNELNNLFYSFMKMCLAKNANAKFKNRNDILAKLFWTVFACTFRRGSKMRKD